MQRADWETKEKDLAFAREIIDQYVSLNEGKPVSLFEVVEKEEDFVLVAIPEWVMVLREHFETEYGDEEGAVIADRVLTTYVTHGSTVH